MLATLRQRDFSLLWFAGLISLSGNWMLQIAVPVVIYQLTGSALAVGGMLLATTVPGILFGSVAGVFVDRWERRRVLMITNVLLAVSILPLLLVVSADMLWLVYLVSFVQSTLNQFFSPAENSLLPQLSKPELLVSANALNALNNNLARLIGPALGGVVALNFGLTGVVIFDVVTYVVAAVLIALIRMKAHPRQSEPSTKRFDVSKVFVEWREGMQLIWRERTVRTLFFYNVLTSVGESVIFVLFVPFITSILGGDSLHVGGIMSAQAVGGIIGGLLIGSIAKSFKTYRLLGISSLIFGIVDLALFNYTQFFDGIAIAYLIIMLAGPLTVGIGASYNTLLQSKVDNAYQGRVFGALNLTFSLFMLVGIAIAGFTSDRIGIVPVINIQGYVYIVAGIMCLLLLREKPALQPVMTPELVKSDG
ncbi:MAG: MFS transporter [Chloroflexi bacterium]|nr:MFS transporter [Chloroflexota bacterium]MCC6892314.1 MFS transporter [Anaerolineae bacterium]